MKLYNLAKSLNTKAITKVSCRVFLYNEVVEAVVTD